MASVDITRIAGNIGALNALNSLQNINKQLSLHQARLSSGKQINSAMDDPAGLSIATKMAARSEGLKTALANIGDAQNMLSVAEAGMSKFNDILVQMRSKAEQAASDTLGAQERQAIQTQLSSFAEQLQNIVDETKWNGVKLLDGTANKQFQTGADKGEFTTWTESQSFDPYTLNVAKNQASNAATNVSAPTTSFGSATPVAQTSAETGYSLLATGRYQVAIADKAASATVGKVNNLGNTWPGAITGVAAGAVTGTELANGNYTFTVTAIGASGTIAITKADGTSLGNVTADTTGSTNINLGNGVIISHSGALAVGNSFSAEYIAANNVKYQLQDGSGGVVQVDVDGAGAGATAKGSYGYFAAGTTVDTGVGATFSTAAAPGTYVVGDKAVFDYAVANKYSVDVSTASKAADYMDTVNIAINTVSSNLATLGSLMARLDFKSDQTSTAQINVEASYNRIMNADMAAEQVQASKFAILQQTATSMLAQANTAPQSLLTLFR